MKKILTILTLVILAGCKPPSDTTTKYFCTNQEFRKVEHEADVCANKVKAYPAQFCYDSAMIRNCTLKSRLPSK